MRRPWNGLVDRLLDDPDYDHIRVNAFDAEDLVYRYVVTAVEDAYKSIVLIEFRLID